MRPDNQADLSSQVTQAMQTGTWAAVHDPAAADSTDAPTGNPDYAYLTAPTDQYGYQEVGGNGSYNPNLASDGTDLTYAHITAATASQPTNCCGRFGCSPQQVGGILQTKYHWTIIGEYHSNWDDEGWMVYSAGASSNIGAIAGIDGKNFSFSGYDRYSTGSGFSPGIGTAGNYDSHQVALYMQYNKTKWEWQNTSGQSCGWWMQWDEAGVVRSPGGHFILMWTNIWNDQNVTQTRWRTDGCTALNNLYKNIQGNAALNSYWFDEPWPFSMSLDHDQGLAYGFATQIFGVGIQAETDHTTATAQWIEYDNSITNTPQVTRNDPWKPFKGQVDSNHFFWGSNRGFDPNGQEPEPKTFYNC